MIGTKPRTPLGRYPRAACASRISWKAVTVCGTKAKATEPAVATPESRRGSNRSTSGQSSTAPSVVPIATSVRRASPLSRP